MYQARSPQILPGVMLCSVMALFNLGCQERSETTNAPAVEPTSTAEATPAGAARPLAQTQHGPVLGYVEDDVLVFKGIRYGADTATTRFAAPAPPAPWTEPLDTRIYGASAPQPQRGRLGLFDSWIPDPDPGNSEDCLFLNVWTPGTDGRKRPVMVWFHGGGFTSGSGSSNVYDGVRLVTRGDVVVVTVNHRLNVFGYLYLDEYGEQFAGSANAGMLDLVASLKWVRENIDEFGGDPNNVLIFGESGGGFKVSTLMAMEAAVGLFHRAVVQSGPALELLTEAEAAKATAALMAELDLDAANIDQIRELPAKDLVAAALAVAEDGVRVGTRPVVDGVHISKHPFTPNAPQKSKDIPLLIGSTQHEMSMLAGASRPELFELTWDTLPEALETAMAGVDAGRVIEGYRGLHPDISAPELFFEAATDNSVFGRGSIELADRQARLGGAPVYQYYLTWRSPVDDGRWAATHALDLGFVFDNVAKSESMSGTGESQQALADAMSEAWLAFARSGNPNHPGLPGWEPYDEDRATMVFDDEPRLVTDPRRREREILDAALRTDAGI